MRPVGLATLRRCPLAARSRLGESRLLAPALPESKEAKLRRPRARWCLQPQNRRAQNFGSAEFGM